MRNYYYPLPSILVSAWVYRKHSDLTLRRFQVVNSPNCLRFRHSLTKIPGGGRQRFCGALFLYGFFLRLVSSCSGKSLTAKRPTASDSEVSMCQGLPVADSSGCHVCCMNKLAAGLATRQINNPYTL